MIQEVSGAELYYERHGSGDPVICLHNFSNNSRALFGPLVPFLAQEYTLHLVDLRGHGRSTHDEGVWSHERVASDIVELMAGLGLGSAYFLAACSGSMAMLRVAREHPELVRAMVVDSSSHKVPESAHRLYKSPADLEPKWKAYYEAANEVYGARYGPVLAQIFYDMRLPECDINIPLSWLREITTPILLLAGDRDKFFPPEVPQEMARLLPNAELLMFQETGHIVMDFYPERVARLAAEFFRTHQQPPESTDN